MSRIGKLPITIPAGVTITVNDDGTVVVKGPKGELSEKISPAMGLKQEAGVLTIERPSDSKEHKALHGLTRSLVNNMVVGVSEGFKTVQIIVGVGYKAEAKGQILELSLGCSHNIIMELAPEIKVETITERGKDPKIILTSCNKQLLGQVAAKIRSLRKPEPYKGKGIKFENEVLRKKAGKSAAAK